ncbi:hypothetical protein HDV01_003997 [Terramyces sp. JEL0728]|nr:hypothetical protein HDV01_003997 [Terramyces sp. JEL0728]
MIECNITLEHTVGIVDYLHLLSCDLQPAMAVITVISLLFVYFLTLSVAAEYVFCPNLSTIAEILHIPESVAGVSLAAFGNGAGDLFSVFVSFQGDLVPLALGELGLPVNDFPSGVPSEISIEDPEFDEEYFQPDLHFRHSFPSRSMFRKGNKLWQRNSFYEPRAVSVETHSPVDDDILNYDTTEFETPFELELRTTLSMLFPAVYKWESFTAIEKILMVLKSPSILLFGLTVPVISHSFIDPTVEPDETQPLIEEPVNESSITKYPRSLFLIQMFLCPTIVCLTTGFFDKRIFHIPVLLLSIMFGMVLAYSAYMLTRTRLVSDYSLIITAVGFVQSILYILAISNELVALLEAIGLLSGIRNSVLGLTLFAFGNCIGELVTNMSIASYGLQTMAITACIAGPLLNTILGIGISSLYKIIASGSAKAVQQLKARPAGGTDPSTWNHDQFAQTHWDYQSNNHGTPMFFPWHRMYILQYEKALRAIDPSITLPYWDWTLDSQNPRASDIFHPQNFGGNGQAGNCVQDGVAAGWHSVVFKPACLKRCNAFSTLYSPEALTGVINHATSFKAIHSAVENGPHASVHTQVGGACGDFGSMASAADPIFFLHHAMVDKIWSKWQSACTSNAKNFEADVNSSMPPFNGVVNDVFDTTGLCYTYSSTAGDLPLSVACPNGKASNGIPKPPAVDNHWAEEMLQALIVGVDSQRVAFVGKRDLASVEVNQLQTYDAQAVPEYSLNENYTVAAPAYNDLSDLVHIRHPAPIPDYHIKMMHMDEKLVRETELVAMKITDDYNNREGYCSPAALKHFNTHNKLGLYGQ